MFGLIRRIKDLEKWVARIEQKESCAIGNHEWVMVEGSYNYEPFIRCSHCRATLEEKK